MSSDREIVALVALDRTGKRVDAVADDPRAHACVAVRLAEWRRKGYRVERRTLEIEAD